MSARTICATALPGFTRARGPPSSPRLWRSSMPTTDQLLSHHAQLRSRCRAVRAPAPSSRAWSPERTSRFSERAVARSYGQALSGPAARETGIRLYMPGNLPCSKGQRTAFALMCALRRCLCDSLSELKVQQISARVHSANRTWSPLPSGVTPQMSVHGSSVCNAPCGKTWRQGRRCVAGLPFLRARVHHHRRRIVHAPV